MKLPRYHHRRLSAKSALLHYFLFLLRSGGLDVQPPARCRSRLVAALAEARATDCLN